MEKTDNQEFKINALQKIREKVEKYSLSAFKLGKLSGLSDVGVSKVLSGKSENPSEKTIRKLLEGIEIYEKQVSSPVTLATINEKLDRILELLRVHGLDIEILYELMDLSPDTTEEDLKKLQEKVKNKLS